MLRKSAGDGRHSDGTTAACAGAASGVAAYDTRVLDADNNTFVRCKGERLAPYQISAERV